MSDNPPAGGDLIALAERCEAATGPDRELDAEIAALFGEVTWRQANYTMEQYAAIRWKEPHPYAGMCEPVYAYTASVDAAMSLVPEGHNWAIDSGYKDGFAAWCFDRELYHIDPCVNATSLALALTAACLRARAAIAKVES